MYVSIIHDVDRRLKLIFILNFYILGKKESTRPFPLTQVFAREELHFQLLEYFGSALILNTFSSNVSTTRMSRRNAHIGKKYVFSVPADSVFEIVRGVSHLGGDRNNNHYANRNGTFFSFKNSAHTRSKTKISYKINF